ncbi:hypothetical protein A3G56_01290 [Candidatus Falkowbacteria bacterium RIFCSPLOWO2_12_FULL_45_10]|uniref:Uncharacterized protein n=1 Tax=Candidatus Falkowbacteria bacterium RIFCSPLOWO2_12_FULL_45_10 TaxID=1797990 RepID=A0A1F5RZE6_9BACT|nr:MAG: hypothetical protein A3G56_01290 [Candidatus Falkowbacteria bacterium RIFCSPLOWO2_12_FULL_45_10]
MQKKYGIALMFVLVFMLIINQWQLSTLNKMAAMASSQANAAAPANPTASETMLSPEIAAVASELLARGVPPVYGAKLGVSFDDPTAAINVLAPLEQDTRLNKLTGALLQRYIAIGQQTACEFCCGATTLVFPDGSKACACAHSAAMRGVIAYLLTTEGNTMSDQQILAEANKWKSVFFPAPTVQKYLASQGRQTASPALPAQVGGC